jgi:hypothetical protein
MFLHQPAPDAVSDIEVECRELTACAGAEAIVVSSSPQNRIKFLEKLRQRLARVRTRGHLFDHVMKTSSFAGRYLDPRHIAEPRMPLVEGAPHVRHPPATIQMRVPAGRAITSEGSAARHEPSRDRRCLQG